jgi:hypothetical protein
MDVRNRVGLYDSYFLCMAGIGFTLPYLPLYLREQGLSDRPIGFVSTLAALAGLVQFPAGVWSDRLNARKPFLVVALGVLALATYLLEGAHGAVRLRLLVVLFAENGACRATVDSLAAAEAVRLAPSNQVGAALADDYGPGSVLLPLAVVQARIAEGRFREDLYYRLNVVCITLPPLAQRRDDIPLLAEHILRRLARKYDWPNLALAPEALAQLCARPWPGNVRELQNVLARAAILSRGRVIGPDDLDPPGSLVLRDILAETERRVIRQALEQENWNRTQAARVLGISSRQLFDKIREYGLQE